MVHPNQSIGLLVIRNVTSLMLYLLGVPTRSYALEVFFPTTSLSTPTTVHPGHLTCPTNEYIFDPIQDHPLFSVSIEHATYSGDRSLPGYLCHKISYTTTCDENFLGAQTITQTTSIEPTTFSECSVALGDLNTGNYAPPHFPSPDCNWMKSTTKRSEGVILDAHSVQYDPYTGDLVDPIFDGGRKKSGFIETRHKRLFWLGIRELTSDLCFKGTVSKGIIFTKGNESTISLNNAFLHVPFRGNKPLEKSCKHDFCLNQGLRFDDGEWIKMNLLNIPEAGTSLFSSIPYCRPEISIKLPAQFELIKHSEVTSRELINQMRCNDIISKLVNKVSFPLYELSFLSRQSEGEGMVYKVSNGVIYSNLGMYELIDLSVLNTEPNLLGRNKEGKKVYVDWHMGTADGAMTAHSINGISRAGQNLTIPPYLERSISSKLESHANVQLITVDHPALRKPLTGVGLLVDHAVEKHVEGGHLFGISLSVKGIVSKLIIGLIIIITLLSAWCIFKTVICIIHIRKTQSRGSVGYQVDKEDGRGQVTLRL